MSTTAVDGINAAGRQPVWAIDAADLTDITDDTTSIPLAALEGAQKMDCYYDFGGLALDRTATTRSRQRACEKVAKEIKIGETITGTLTAVYDQQAADTETINLAYGALPEGGDVYLFIANGWDQDQAPTAETKGDLWRVTVSQKAHLLAASAEEDLMFRADLNGSLFVPNVTLSGTAG